MLNLVLRYSDAKKYIMIKGRKVRYFSSVRFAEKITRGENVLPPIQHTIFYSGYVKNDRIFTPKTLAGKVA